MPNFTKSGHEAFDVHKTFRPAVENPKTFDVAIRFLRSVGGVLLD